MYRRTLNIFISTQDKQLETLLRSVPAAERFSHSFSCSPGLDKADLKEYSVIILDFESTGPESMAEVYAAKDEQAVVVGCFSANNFSALAQHHQLFDQVWTKPLDESKVRSSFTELLLRLKDREDAMLTRNYLDTLIDSLPDLIWFKDARGAHLKVNNSFCEAVGKTKEQIQGRGHYYIWDIEPDEYAEGEYVCLESEEIVLKEKKTMLFDETVKCGDELRKFKTYKSPIFDTNGEVVGTVGFARDVTDLQNLMIELNVLVESLPFAVMVTDKDRTITSLNKKFTDIFQLVRSEIIGQPVDSLLDDTQTFTRSKRWLLDWEDGQSLLLSKDVVLRVHEEKLLDIFGMPAGFIHLFMDITLEHQSRNKLLIDATTDHLTRLHNRRSLHDFMSKTPCRRGTALLLADLDNFKEVNDQYGHDEGDKVLVAFSDLLLRTFPATNLFRLGGDEFAVILHDLENRSLPMQFAEQLLAEFTTSISQEFSHTNISVSIGIAMDEDDTGDFGELFKKADMALYESKNSGKNASTFWER